METIIKFIITVALATILLALLPSTPFTAMISAVGQLPYIQYVAWFIPISEIISTTLIWVSTIFSYFLVSWALRQLDLLGQ